MKSACSVIIAATLAETLNPNPPSCHTWDMHPSQGGWGHRPGELHGRFVLPDPQPTPALHWGNPPHPRFPPLAKRNPSLHYEQAHARAICGKGSSTPGADVSRAGGAAI